jgi:hypothetical protein
VRRAAIPVAMAVAMAVGMVLAMLSVPTVANAGGGEGALRGSPPQLGVGLRVSVPGIAGTGHDTYAADDPSAPRPVFERAIPSTSGGGAGALGNLCTTPDGPQGPEYRLGNGWYYYIELFATATGAYLSTLGTVCVPLGPAGVVAPPPPPTLGQPPTIGEIWKAVGLPVPAIGVSPGARGITGLPTWIWTAGSAPVAVSVSLSGFRITGTARVVGYGEFPGEGGWVRSRSGGREGRPALTHTYEQAGTFRLGVATLWSASAVLTGPGLDAPFAFDLGTAVVTNGRDYPVVSVTTHLL